VLASAAAGHIAADVGTSDAAELRGIASAAVAGAPPGTALDECGAVRRLLSLAVLAAPAAGCAVDETSPLEAGITLVEAIPPFGQPDTIDVATWNMEWFGSWHEGPSDEALQLAGARAVVSGLDLDLWAVEEVVSQSQFDDLLAGLPLDGFLANDPSVEGGSYYGTGEQKVGIIYRPDLFEVISARTILRDESYAFAGRPPLEVEMREVGGGEPFYVIVLHAKASRGFADWQRRRDGAVALADHLAGERAGDDVLLIGDYNDDLDESTRGSSPSPYADLVASYFFTTWSIAVSDQPTTEFGGLPIDHALAAGRLADAYVPGSAAVFQADDYIDDYGQTTSDHLPVLMRFARGGPAGPPLVLNEILANEPGADTAGEFVEIVNPGASAVDVGGYRLSDSLGLRHVLPAGTSIAAGAALVVQSGDLALSNGGDTVTLADAGGRVVDRVVYEGALGSRDGVSMTRTTDGDVATPMVLHDEVSSLASSPGLRHDGTPF
jgi:endonuclease/exonuclease/phosphatase family metal-dependent hydrolase